jgi:hypothetical protein
LVAEKAKKKVLQDIYKHKDRDGAVAEEQP